MPNDVKETIDLHYFRRYDANTVAAQVKISSLGVYVTGALEPSMPYALFLNKAGNILAIKEDKNGIELVTCGRGAQRFSCARLLSDMLKSGVEIPQTADLDWDESINGYVARLKMIEKAADPDAATLPQGKRRAFKEG